MFRFPIFSGALLMLLALLPIDGAAAASAPESSARDTQPQPQSQAQGATEAEAETEAESEAEDETAVRQPVRIAVLDFDVTELGDDELGQQIASILQATMAGESNLRLVERAEIDEALQEIELSLTGLVDTDEAVRVGKLVGAQILITGRAFAIGDGAMITVKLIGTETSLVDGLLVRGRVQELDELIADMAMRVIERMPQSTQKLLPEARTDDRLEQLQTSLQDRPRPTVVIVVTEEHVDARVTLPDPAVQTEIRHVLRLCGFEVIEVPRRVVTAWLEDGRETRLRNWPVQLADADLLIHGEAFSEFAGRMGNVITAAARAEVQIIDNDTAEVLFADRTTTREVDLAEQIAARSALQKAGRELGLRILEHFDQTLPEPDPAQPAQENANGVDP